MRSLTFLATLGTVVVLAAAFARPAAAQIRFGEFGFMISTASSAAGDPCWGFDCTPRRLRVRPGDVATMLVRAPLGAGYLVVASPTASSCVTIPGLHNQLVLDGPLITAVVGRIDQRNTMRFCYDGFATVQFVVPNVPPGVSIAFQAAAQIGTPQQPAVGWGLSSAVVLGT